MKTAIIVDSAAYLSPAMRAHPDIYQVDIQLNFNDGTSFADTADLEQLRTFIERVKKESELPTTAQPLPGEYIALLDELIEKGYDSVISIHLSSGISGTYDTVCSLLRSYADRIDGYAVDSKGATIVVEKIIGHMLDALDAGKEPAEAAEIGQWVADHTSIYLMVEDMTNLAKSGRVNAGVAKIGGVLKVRPLLYFNEQGEIVLFETIRTNKKVYKRLADLAREKLAEYPQGAEVIMAHADALDTLETLEDYLREHVPEYTGSFDKGLLGPAVCNHTAAGAIGLGIIPNPPQAE